MKEDPIVWPVQLRKALGGVSSETLRKWRKANKLPAPDIQLSQRTCGWRLSTLHKAGIKIAPPQPVANESLMAA